MTHDVGNSGSGLGQAQKCGRVKPVRVYTCLCNHCLLRLVSLYYTL